jgi:uncharacterized protein
LTHFIISGEMKVQHNGEAVCNRRWDRRIKR